MRKKKMLGLKELIREAQEEIKRGVPPQGKPVPIKTEYFIPNDEVLEVPSLIHRLDQPEEEYDEYKINSATYQITFIELAIFNNYLYSLNDKKSNDVKVFSYGHTDEMSRITFCGPFDNTKSWFFQCKFENDDNEYIFQTKIYIENRSEKNQGCFTGPGWPIGFYSPPRTVPTEKRALDFGR
jgi:hypothetical protein